MTKTCSVAFERELVASTRSLRFDDSYSARVMETVSTDGVAGFIVRAAERDELFKVAMTVALVAAETCVVLTVKFADDAPAATVTLAGTVAAALLLANRTAAAVWTFAFNVTVPVTAFPPVTVLGFNINAETVTGAGGGGGGAAPVVFIKLLKPGLAPPTPKATSGLPSPLKSLAVMKTPPILDLSGGTR